MSTNHSDTSTTQLNSVRKRIETSIILLTESRFTLLFFILFAALVYLLYPPVLDAYNSSYWSLTYRYGFLPRSLPGTILDLAIKGRVTYQELLMTVEGIYLIIFVIYIFLIIILWKKLKSKYLFIYLSFFIFNPYTVKWAFNDFGRFDFLMIFLSFLGIFFYKKNTWMLFLIAIVSILTHENYIVAFFPFFGMLFLVVNKFNQKSVYFICIWVTLSLLLTIIMFYFNKPVQNYDDFLSRILRGIEYPIDKYYITQVYYWGLSDHIYYVRYMLATHIKDIKWLLIYLPFFAHFGYFWKYLIKTTKNKKYIFLAISSLSPLALMISGIDIGRWIAMVVILNYVAIFYLAWADVYKINAWLESLFRNKYSPVVFLMMILYMTLKAPGVVWFYENGSPY